MKKVLNFILKHDMLWDSTSIVHEDKLLNTILEDSGWLDLPLESGVSADGYSGKPQYRKIGNIVEIRGSISFTKASSGNTSLATLPEGFRPTGGIIYWFAPCGGNTVQRLLIRSNGRIESEWIRNLQDEKNPAVSGKVTWTDLHIVFMI